MRVSSSPLVLIVTGVFALDPCHATEPVARSGPTEAVSPATELESMLSRARLHAGAGQFADALALFTRITELAPGDHRGHSGRASMLNNLDRYSEGLAAIERAIALAPENPMLYYNRGLSLAEVGRFEAAVADFDKAVRGRPALPMPYADRAAARLSLGQWDAALMDCEAAIKADANYIWARYYRGQIRFLQGDFKAADADFAAVAEQQADFVPARVWKIISARRAGAPQEVPPAGRVAIAANAAWPAPVLAFLSGDIDTRVLLRKANEYRVVDDERRLSAAHVLIGLQHLLLGRKVAARDSFNTALSFKVPAHFEQQIARVELARMR